MKRQREDLTKEKKIRKKRKIDDPFPIQALPTDVLALILPYYLDNKREGFVPTYRKFMALMMTCKKFNIALDRPQNWVNVGFKLLGNYPICLPLTGENKIMEPFVWQPISRSFEYMISGILYTRGKVVLKELTENELEMIPLFKGCLRAYFGRHCRSQQKLNRKDLFLGKYVK
jgi:hypothetical protein